jgi:hypothetical protein
MIGGKFYRCARSMCSDQIGRATFGANPLALPVTHHALSINSCLSSLHYCLVSDRRSAALNCEGVVPSHAKGCPHNAEVVGSSPTLATKSIV